MLVYRLSTGAALIALLVLVLVFDQRFAPWFPLWFLTATLVMVASAIEVVSLLGHTTVKPSGAMVIGGVLALVVANWAPHLVTQYGPGLPNLSMPHDSAAAAQVMAWPLWAFVAIVMITFVGQSIGFSGNGGTMARISGTILAVAYVGLLGSFLVQCRWLEGPYDGLIPLALVVATAKGADTGAYTIGRLFGRHKLWPSVSPNKTIEGALGGLVFGVLATLIVVGLSRAFAVPTLKWGAAIGYGLLVGTAAQVGDLMESMLKRDCDRKDASTALPGFGGVLDVMDSLLFAGPVAYGYWLCLGP